MSTIDKDWAYNHKVVHVNGHWEVQDSGGRTIVSGDTKAEVLADYDAIMDVRVANEGLTLNPFGPDDRSAGG
jgi:hypothetical protein